MESFLTLNLTSTEKRLLHNWRMFFQVNTLSDILNPEQTKILQVFRTQPKGKLMNRMHSSKLNWPNQTEPGVKGFKIWIKCLKACFNMQSNGNIYYQMGDWHLETLHNNNEWKYYYNSPLESVFVCTDDQIFQYPMISKRCTSAVFNMNIVPMIHPSLPDNCIPTEITSRADGMFMARFSKNKLISQMDSNIIHLKAMEKMEEWKNVMVENIVLLDNQKSIELISDNKEPILIFSDGGVSDYNGTFGIVIADGKIPLVTNKGKIYSVVFQQSPYRSELYSLLASIITFNEVFNETNIEHMSNKTIILHTDNKSII